MDRLKIPQHFVTAFAEHARKMQPLEACGLLTGKDSVAHALYLMTNGDAAEEHFTLLPEQQFRVVKSARAGGERVVAVIHSHPVSPARPSKEDLRLAVDPDLAYLILTLLETDQPLRGYYLRSDQLQGITLDLAPAEHHYGVWVPPRSAHTELELLRTDLQRVLDGQDTDQRLRPKRVKMGSYEQRNRGMYMVRVRVPAGIMTATQLERVAELARQYGSGRIHLTTRHDVQIHEVVLSNTITVMEGLLAVGLSTRGGGGNTVRNVVVCPRAGVCPHQVLDVTQQALGVTTAMVDESVSFDLPRKFKVAFSGCERDCARARVADVGFIARHHEGHSEFAVFAGGGLGAHPRTGVKILEHLSPMDTVRTVRAARDLFNELGDRKNRNRARLRYAVKRVGEQEFKTLFLRQWNACAECFLPELEVQNDVTDLTGTLIDLEALPEGAQQQHTEGLYSFECRPWLGDLSAEQALALAELMRQDALGMRLTTRQGMVFYNLRGQDLVRIADRVAAICPTPKTLGVLGMPLACAGASTCQLGLCHSRDLAAAMSERLAKRTSPLPSQFPLVRISGCSNSCAAHQVAELGLQGMVRRVNDRVMPCYAVWVSGNGDETTGDLSRMLGIVPAAVVPEMFAKLAEQLSALSFQETLPDLEVVVLDLIAQFDLVPTDGYPEKYFQDWGNDESFTLSGRGPGECSAGVLDLVRADLEAAESHWNGFKAESDLRRLNESGLYAARALLVIRGIDTVEASAIFDGFTSQFVATGLIPEAWVRPALEYLRAVWVYEAPGNIAQADTIRRFLEIVKQLYATMDSHLNFTPLALDSDEQVSHTTVDSDAKELSPEKTVALDLRGVACPMNFVKAKLALEKVSVGEVLDIWLDDGAPIQNVPASFTSHGQEVVSVEQSDEGHHVLSVRRLR